MDYRIFDEDNEHCGYAAGHGGKSPCKACKGAICIHWMQNLSAVKLNSYPGGDKMKHYTDLTVRFDLKMFQDLKTEILNFDVRKSVIDGKATYKSIMRENFLPKEGK